MPLEPREDVRHAPPHDGLAWQLGDPLRGAVPKPDHALRIDEDDAVPDRREDARRLRALLDLSVEPRVLDGARCAPAELFGEPEIRLIEASPRLRRDERDRTDHSVAGAERHAHVRAQPELAQQVEV